MISPSVSTEDNLDRDAGRGVEAEPIVAIMTFQKGGSEKGD